MKAQQKEPPKKCKECGYETYNPKAPRHYVGCSLRPIEPPQEWEKAKKLGLECSHGNYVGWCNDCPKEYGKYVFDFIRQQKHQSFEEGRREAWQEIQNHGITREVWNTEEKDYTMEDLVLLKDICDYFTH